MQLPFMRWAPVWREPGTLRADLMAGLTGAVVVLPQGVAFATLAGLPPQYGLYAAMLPCIVAALFGSSRLMVTGPANAISLTTMALIAPLAVAGSPHYVQLVLTLSFLVGAMQLLLGLARVGAIVERVPHSVVVGFTAGAALLHHRQPAAGGAGLNLPRGSSAWQQLQAVCRAPGASCSWPALLAALLTVARGACRAAAEPLGAGHAAGGAGRHAVGAKLLAWLVPAWPVLATVQALPGPLPPLSWPDLSIDTVRSLFGADAGDDAAGADRSHGHRQGGGAAVQRHARRQPRVHWPGAGQPGWRVFFVDAGQRLVQPLGRQRRGRRAHAAGRSQRGRVPGADPQRRCAAGRGTCRWRWWPDCCSSLRAA